MPKLLTISEIAERHGVSRQTLHNLRRRGVFPPPVAVENSTRARFDADAVAAYFAANPKQPGKKLEARLKPPLTTEGDPQ
ncbi:MAG TPA: helix-turn-helix domain-containing protein [Mycobacteriales bacterium]